MKNKLGITKIRELDNANA